MLVASLHGMVLMSRFAVALVTALATPCLFVDSPCPVMARPVQTARTTGRPLNLAPPVVALGDLRHLVVLVRF